MAGTETMLPPSVPKASQSEVRERSAPFLSKSGDLFLFARRGYYKRTMGRTPFNERNLFDDAIWLVGPDVFLPANANTDPVRLGWNPGVGKPFAQLMTGVWPFVKGAHKGKRPALRQPDEDQAKALGIKSDFKVLRGWGEDDHRNYVETGYFAINIHSGGHNTTSSWGCITLPPEQFLPFMNRTWKEMDNASMKYINLVLTEA